MAGSVSMKGTKHGVNLAVLVSCRKSESGFEYGIGY